MDMKIELIGSKYQEPNRQGDFGWMIKQAEFVSSPFFGVKVAPSPRRCSRPRSLLASPSKASRQQVSLRSKAPQIPFL